MAVLFLHPESGDYFNATPRLLELEFCADKTNIAMNGDAYKETTLSNLARFNRIADYMHEKGQKVVASVNITLPWILGNVEPKADVLIAVNEYGVCVSRNDVPGYDKDKYLREGMTYAYKDSTGNEYKLDFGLSY